MTFALGGLGNCGSAIWLFPLSLPKTRHSSFSYSLFTFAEGVGFGWNVGRDTTRGLIVPVREAGRSFIPRSGGQRWQPVFGYTDWGRQRDALLLPEERPGILLRNTALHKMSFLVITSRLETFTRSLAVGSSTSHMKKNSTFNCSWWFDSQGHQCSDHCVFRETTNFVRTLFHHEDRHNFLSKLL